MSKGNGENLVDGLQHDVCTAGGPIRIHEIRKKHLRAIWCKEERHSPIKEWDE
jgi:hypothetical protein